MASPNGSHLYPDEILPTQALIPPTKLNHDYDDSTDSPPTPNIDPENPGSKTVDYAARANWLRAAVLGANDGLVSVASLMIGVGAVSGTAKAMVISGQAGLVAGACSMAIGEYVSVCTQYDIQKARIERERVEEKESPPSPVQAAWASALAFMMGGMLPLLTGGFIEPWGVRVGVVCAVTSVGLAGFGAAGGYLGGASVWKSAIRVLVGGWFAMLITYGVSQVVSTSLQDGNTSSPIIVSTSLQDGSTSSPITLSLSRLW